MRTNRDPSHVPRGRLVRVEKNEKGEYEVRCSTNEQMLLGTFQTLAMTDIFIEAVSDICGCRTIPEAELVAA